MKKEAQIFKALSDETRVKIIVMLSKGSLCACKILEAFDITQPTLSYHMKILCTTGLVNCEKKGLWNYYSLNDETVLVISDYIKLIRRTA